MYTIILVFVNFTALGHDECSVRDNAEKFLSHESYVRILPEPAQIEDPEIRYRVTRLKRNFNPEIVLFKTDKEKWFWEYAFEDRSSVFTDEQIRWVFHDYPEFGAAVQRQLINRDLIPTWCYVCGQTEIGGGYFSHLTGHVCSYEPALMRAHFNYFTQKGQAQRAVIGGMYGISKGTVLEYP